LAIGAQSRNPLASCDCRRAVSAHRPNLAVKQTERVVPCDSRAIDGFVLSQLALANFAPHSGKYLVSHNVALFQNSANGLATKAARSYR
jgi:hypothetical protein